LYSMTASLLKSSSKDEGVNPIPPNYLKWFIGMTLMSSP
jgi:hypothetical protein